MDKEQKQQEQEQSTFDLTTARVLERYAWYADRTIDMMPYSAVYKLVSSLVNELAAAHKQTVATMRIDHADEVLQANECALNIAEITANLFDDLEEANTTIELSKAMIDLLMEHLNAAISTIKFEKRTRLELPRDANGNRIYPDSMLERWGAIEDFWYSNGAWMIRGHDTSAPWVPASKVVVCPYDSDDEPAEENTHEDSEAEPQEDSAQATPDAKRPHGCKSRDEAESALKAFCLGNVSITELLDLLYNSDDDSSEEA